jgi:uncharacterized protein (TIGR02145 family)
MNHRILSLFLIMLLSIIFVKCTTYNDNISVEGCEKPIVNEVKICSQFWMTKNLDVDHYRNGEAIRYAESDADWRDAGNKKEGAWCYYNNDPANVAIYGKLYNWYAVNDQRKLAPVGYHIPTDAEWKELENCLGGSDVAGGKLKEAGTAHWASPNTGATNSSGFSGLPGGYRYYNGSYYNVRSSGVWWSSTEYDETYAWVRGLYYRNTNIDIGYGYKVCGFSVRCVRD